MEKVSASVWDQWEEEIDFFVGKVGIHPDDFWRLAPIECKRIADAWLFNYNKQQEIARLTHFYQVMSFAKKPPASPEFLYPLPTDGSVEEKVEAKNARLENKKKYTHEELLALWDKKE